MTTPKRIDVRISIINRHLRETELSLEKKDYCMAKKHIKIARANLEDCRNDMSNL